MKKILLIIFLLFVFLTPKSFAADKFSTDYNVTYNIGNSSDTTVNLNVSLTNTTDNYYASSYSLQVGFKDIRNLTASDNDGKVNATVKQTDTGSLLTIPFNSRVVGLNKKLTFNVSFITREIASDLGNVWDVNIPGISSDNDFSHFNVKVKYPSKLGKPTFIKPQINNALANATENEINFTKGELGNSGISLAFGDFQVYGFNLTYHLQNTNVFKVKTEIALPPDTNYQEISIDQIYPKPDNVYADKDGNWLAQYTLLPSKKVNIKVLGQAKIYLRPKSETLDETQKAEYLKSADFWQTTDPKIIELAKSLKTPEAIYNYVVKTLKYDFSRIESNSPRLGAVKTLNNPDSAVCLEFTDLFVTLARAAGIPARAISGYAYTDNSGQRPLSLVKDILHAWPEYYDYAKNTWVMIDPTWGNTTNGVDYFNTLDFDHFTFVINGEKSSYPIPAGGYKFEKDLNSKDVNVEITPEFTPKAVNLNSTINLSSTQTAGLPIKGTITIQNTSGRAFAANELAVFTDNLTPNSQSLGISTIPPYGSIEIPIEFNKTDFLTKLSDTIRIAVNNQNVYKNIQVVPFFLNIQFLIGGIIIVSTIFGLSIIIAGYRYLPFFKRRRENNLLWESKKPQEESL